MHITLDSLGLAVPTRVVAVDTPEFGPGKQALLGEMTANERDERIELAWQRYCEQRGQDPTASVGFRAWAVAASLCDPERKWLAPGPADISAAAELLGKAPTNVVTRCFLEVKKLQGLTKEDVEALEKNSPAGGGTSSASLSASDSAPSGSLRPGSRPRNGRS